MSKDINIRDLENNKLSFYMLFQKALASKDKATAIEKAIELTRKFCNNHRIKIDVTPDGTFIPNVATPEALFVTDSLNGLLLKDFQLELAMYFSEGTSHSVFDPGETFNVTLLAEKILGKARFVAINVISKHGTENAKSLDNSLINDRILNSKTQANFPEGQQGSLKPISDSLNKYKPRFFDWFGYDISGKRKRLIKEIISYYKNDPKVNYDIRVYLATLESSLSKSKVTQDIELGIFLNLLRDKGYEFINIHKSLRRIIIAGEHPYRDKKFSLELTEIAAAKELELLTNVLGKLKDANTIRQGVETVVNDWLKSKHQFINKEKDLERATALQKQFYKIFINLADILGMKADFKEQKLPDSFRMHKEINTLSMGELVETICSAIAQTNTRHHPERYYDERSKLVNSLPSHLQLVHKEYIDHSTKQINSLRVLNIFQKMRSLEGLSSSLLEVFQDESLHENFHTHIDSLLSKSASTKWNKSFTEIVKSEEFKSFAKDALEAAHLKDKELRYYSKIINNLSPKHKLSSFREELYSKKPTTKM